MSAPDRSLALNPQRAAGRANGSPVKVPAFALYVREAALPFVLQSVEAAIGRIDHRAAGAPVSSDTFTLLGRTLAAWVLRERTRSSERPRLAALQGLRPEDLKRAESLQAAWAGGVPTQALRDELELIDLAYTGQLRALRADAAGGSGRGRQILSRFAAFMRAERRGKALGAVAHALGRDLDEADRLLARIRDAHALAAAGEERDLLRLAAALGLQRADFLVLGKLHAQGFFGGGDAADADAHDRAAAAYGRYITDLRQAIARCSRILMRGTATIPALLEGAMVLINGDPRDPRSTPAAPRDAEADPRYPDQLIVHPDRGLPQGGFIHGLPVSYGVFDRVDGAPARRLRDGFVYLVENPVSDHQSDDAPRRGRDRLRVVRGGFFHGPVAARFTGSGDRCVRPRLTHLGTHRGFGFRGNVADGSELVFSSDGRAYLDGTEVTERCHVFKGGLFGSGRFDDATAAHAYAVSVPAHALERNRPLPALEPAAPLPTLRLLLGASDWQFDVEEGAYDASGFDDCVFALPADDTRRAALPPAAKLQLLWREHEPFTARVLLPAALQSLEPDLLEGANLRTLVRAGLERFRAAGIRLEVDWFDDTWVLDESVLRDQAAQAGLGVSFDSTIPAAEPLG